MHGRVRRCAGDAGQQSQMCSFMSREKIDQLLEELSK
jgi:hypothetical protein